MRCDHDAAGRSRRCTERPVKRRVLTLNTSSTIQISNSETVRAYFATRKELRHIADADIVKIQAFIQGTADAVRPKPPEAAAPAAQK